MRDKLGPQEKDPGAAYLLQRDKKFGEGPVTLSVPMAHVERQPKKSGAGYFQFTMVHFGQRTFGGADYQGCGRSCSALAAG